MLLMDQLMADMKEAMKAKDKERLATIRMLKSALMYATIKDEGKLSDNQLSREQELAVLGKEKKQREESIADFKKAGRDDLVAATEKELEIVESYMPKPFTEEELSKLVDETIAEVGASSKADFGKVMKAIVPKITGRADGKEVSKLVGAALSK